MAPSPTTTPLVTKGTNFGDSQYSVLEVDQKGKDAMEKIPKPKGPIIWATSNSAAARVSRRCTQHRANAEDF